MKQTIKPITGYKKLAIDQYDNKYYFNTIMELKNQLGYTKATKIYQDTKNGPQCVGRKIGPVWLTFYCAIQS